MCQKLRADNVDKYVENVEKLASGVKIKKDIHVICLQKGRQKCHKCMEDIENEGNP